MLVISLLVSSYSYGQKFGVGIAFATSNAMNFELLCNSDDNDFKLGVSYQFSDARGKLVSEQLANYGRTIDGTGSYFFTVDLGYGKTINDKIQLDGELSIGSLNYYTNYIDRRFSEGGYHMIIKKETVVGVGVNAGYLINPSWCLFTGFNTIRKLQFGVRWIFI